MEFDGFIFVHAGIDNWKDSDPEILLACKEFYNKKYKSNKNVVVEHWEEVTKLQALKQADVVLLIINPKLPEQWYSLNYKIDEEPLVL
ncbi:MAG: hypothetical protein KAX49_03020 [Halanaerobiales bacterium]|nr:hypothetical protein [Halanaerobiales bacterium]